MPEEYLYFNYYNPYLSLGNANQVSDPHLLGLAQIAADKSMTNPLGNYQTIQGSPDMTFVPNTPSVETLEFGQEGGSSDGDSSEGSDGMSTGVQNATKLGGQFLGKTIGGGYQSKGGDVLSGLSSVASAIPGPYGAAISAGLATVSGLTNRAFGSKMNEENINNLKGNISNMRNFSTNAGSYDELATNISNAPAMKSFNTKYVGKDGWWGNKAKRTANKLRQQQHDAQLGIDASIENNMTNIGKSALQNMELNYMAEGGSLHSNGAVWNDGMTTIGNGGTHEENPYEGVAVSTDEQGNPNLLEEGEVLWNDYVFSDRLVIPEEVKAQYGIKGKGDLSFAKAVNKIKRSAEERPNDPLTKKYVDEILNGLMVAQESVRKQQELEEQELLNQLQGVEGEEMPQDAEQALQEQALQEQALQEQAIQQQDMQAEMIDPAMQGLEAYAYGGDLRRRLAHNPAYIYGLGGCLFGDGGSIFIKPSRRGTFTAAATKHGMGVQEFASKVLSNPDDYSPAMRKKAQFAKNASHWHSYGGNLYEDGGGTINPYEYSTDWSDFPYYTNGQYDSGYLNFVNNLSDNWVDRIMSGQYGSMDRYKAKNNTNPTLKQVQNLATDHKYSDMHKAMAAAYKESLLGVDPVTGNMPSVWDRVRPTKGFGNIPTLPKDLGLEDRLKGISAPKIDNRTLAGQVKGLDDKDPWITNLRYAPIIGAGLGVFSDAMGWSNRPDYSNANAILNASRGLGNVRSTPIGDYLRYNPLDRNYYLNQMAANTRATERGITDVSGMSRGAAMAGLVGTNYNALNQAGQLARAAEEYNLKQRAEVAEFNRGTNQFNSQQSLSAQQINAKQRQLSINAALQAANLRAAEKARVDAARSANLTNLFESLGNLGIDAVNRADRDKLIRSGLFGTLSQRPYGWGDKKWKDYRDWAARNPRAKVADFEYYYSNKDKKTEKTNG